MAKAGRAEGARFQWSTPGRPEGADRPLAVAATPVNVRSEVFPTPGATPRPAIPHNQRSSAN